MKKQKIFGVLSAVVMSVGMIFASGTSVMAKEDFVDYIASDGSQYYCNVNADDTLTITMWKGNVTELTIPSTMNNKVVAVVGGFYDCDSLTSVKIPSGVTTINSAAFGECRSLTSIEIPSSVTSIGDNAFYSCSSLTSITIPSGVTTIEDCTFSGCSSLTSVKLPSSLTSIGDLAFYLAPLKSIELPSNLTSIGELAFSNASFTSIKIPSSVTSIGYGAFGNCRNLTSVEIPSSVTSIEAYTFSGCSSLTSVKIPSSVTSIGERAFINCNNLTSIVIPPSVTSIGLAAFDDSLTIYGYTGTTAESYATSNHIAFKDISDSNNPGNAGHTVPYYSLISDGGSWNGTQYRKADGTIAIDVFFFDGSYTYYLQADGTPMKDKLTYHPDGQHIIYLDENGHEVFSSFRYCPSVGYTCYFDSNGYIYKDQITFVSDKTYYLNGNGKMENEGWFQFANGRDYGYANWDGTLNTGGFSYDPWGRVVFYHWNGMVARGLISDGAYYYNMDQTDGHYLGQFPVQ